MQWDLKLKLRVYDKDNRIVRVTGIEGSNIYGGLMPAVQVALNGWCIYRVVSKRQALVQNFYKKEILSPITLYIAVAEVKCAIKIT